MSTTDRRTVDLDAARTARAEKVGPAPVVVLEGQEYELARELPMDAVFAFAELLDRETKTPDPDVVTSALEHLFGEHWPKLRPKLSVHDCMYVLAEILELYGTNLPERSASASS